MRVKVDNFGKPPYFGEFLGLLAETSTESLSAIVRADNFGLFLLCVHPSRITLVTPENEKDYQP